MVATDMDGTVIFSERAMGDDRPDLATLHPVDIDGDRIYAYMTGSAVAGWTALAEDAAVVPVTTRSVPQYTRLRLPGPRPPLAVVCNGGRILVDGESDPDWDRTVRAALTAGGAPFAQVWAQAAAWRDGRGFAALRAVEEFFLYLSVEVREDWLTEFAGFVADWCRERGWRASLQGRKLYLLPDALDKAPAVAEVARRLGADRIVAGGDSLLDARMLEAADAAIRPAHGELHATGFRVPHCHTTAGRGAAAGDEILAWYNGQVNGSRLADHK
ncbi:hypothetical protein Val02_44850 [Virgisporangium aliadipatigenens]|uniref:HAD family hydrolase n=1 Tax=Virgisporangium aliadipatigenens TaxID=741659 RepID=A0A8J3YLF7_9ACTN|nr:HAD family hydrolase [Virgisporangium aliadipatigenens]GIJ47599.1 hypothetical protein Val02_44850 [Virgisporangium aliadipatigenens]